MLQTALVERHRELGGRLIDFAGWEMPVQYSGILDEHRAVRERVGVFDLSHMGEVWVSGPNAAAGLAAALVTDPRRLADGRAQYSMICAVDGGIIDDLIVYRVGAERFMVVPNAGNREIVVAALQERLAGSAATVDDASLRTSLVAIQGPRAADVLRPLTNVDLGPLRYYSIVGGQVAGKRALVARTGYTGEDGLELFLDWDDAPAVWDALLLGGRQFDVLPCGLGARDTLRLEAGMPLYGNELSRDTNPYEAGLGRIVKLEKDTDFVGRAALAQVAEQGPRRMLVGLTLSGRAIARHGYPVLAEGAPEDSAALGIVTSGTQSPTLGVPIAMAYVPPSHTALGTMVEIGIRAATARAEVVALPFYKRASG